MDSRINEFLEVKNNLFLRAKRPYSGSLKIRFYLKIYLTDTKWFSLWNIHEWHRNWRNRHSKYLNMKPINALLVNR